MARQVEERNSFMYKMSEIAAEYKKRLVTADVAATKVLSGDKVSYGFSYMAPHAVDEALAKRLKEGSLKGIEIINTLSVRKGGHAVFRETETAEQCRLACAHFSGLDRKINKEGRGWFVPMFFNEEPKFWTEIRPVDVVTIQVGPMDQWGNFYLGPTVADIWGYLEKARTVIVEVNENMPKAMGFKNQINLEKVDYIVEGNNPALDELPAVGHDQDDEKIAGYITELIEEGSTLQLGIGAVPNCIGALLADTDIREIYCHSEMLSEAYIDLFEAGKLAGAVQHHPGKIVYTFSMGSKRLYDFLDGNQMGMVAPVDYVNNIGLIASIDRFVSVNGALEVDMYGQVSAETAGYRHISGTGGQMDFVQGAFASKGGKSFICLHSTNTLKDGTVKSTISPILAEGSVVTTPRAATHYIVTEHGTALLKGKTTWERAEELINVAHPDFRDELVKEAEKMGIWCNTSKTSY